MRGLSARLLTFMIPGPEAHLINFARRKKSPLIGVDYTIKKKTTRRKVTRRKKNE